MLTNTQPRPGLHENDVDSVGKMNGVLKGVELESVTYI